MKMSDDVTFDKFMHLFFHSEKSVKLNAHEKRFLQILVSEAPQWKVDALVECLNSDKLNKHQKRNVLDCLKIIGTKEANEAIKGAVGNNSNKAISNYAKGLLACMEFQTARNNLKSKNYREALSSIKQAIKFKPYSIKNSFFYFEVLLNYLLGKFSQR